MCGGLPMPAPYFQAAGCSIIKPSLDEDNLQCTMYQLPSTLVRLELYSGLGGLRRNHWREQRAPIQTR